MRGVACVHVFYAPFPFSLNFWSMSSAIDSTSFSVKVVEGPDPLVGGFSPAVAPSGLEPGVSLLVEGGESLSPIGHSSVFGVR